MGRAHLLSSLVVVLGLTGCQHAIEIEAPTPDTLHPESYVGGGVTFAYPGNWSLREDVGADDDAEVRQISVGVPGVGGAYLRVFSPPPPNLDFKAFVDAFSQHLEQRTPAFMRLSRVHEDEVASVVAGEERLGVRREYTWRIMLQVFRVALEFHRVDVDERSVFLVTVASGSETASASGFDLIKESLRVRSGHDISQALVPLGAVRADDTSALVEGVERLLEESLALPDAP